MSELSITGITFDQPAYRAGDTITVSIAYTGSGFALTATASALDHTGVLTGTFTILPAWAVTDDGDRAWMLQGDDGATATFTAVA